MLVARDASLVYLPYAHSLDEAQMGRICGRSQSVTINSPQHMAATDEIFVAAVG
jgi:hypothetical protein